MEPRYIIIHCSDSTFGNARLIDEWHRERGFDRCGYQFVICNGHEKSGEYIMSKDGAIETGRWLDEIGAHCRGYNKKSIGICFIGINEFTECQMDSGIALIHELMDMHEIPKERVLMHYETEFANGKTCPNIDGDFFRALL